MSASNDVRAFVEALRPLAEASDRERERENESIYDTPPNNTYHELCDDPKCQRCREFVKDYVECKVTSDWIRRNTDTDQECGCGEPECAACAAQAREATKRSLEAEADENAAWAAKMDAVFGEKEKP